MRILEFLAAYFRSGGGRVVERPATPVTGWGETDQPGPLGGPLSGATMSVPAEPGAIDAQLQSG